MSRKLCGYDLNGWKDCAARNWRVKEDGEEHIDGQHTSTGVLNPAVVRVGTDSGVATRGRDSWVGGSQAALAPHGRGGGWGDIGTSNRRRLVRRMLADHETPPAALAAALSGHARGAKYCAIAIDDHPDTSEELQERLLTAVATARLGRGLLVWRSVLSVLGCLASTGDLIAPRNGLRIGVLGHVGEGFTLQKLTLRLEAGARVQVFAPERHQTATLLKSRLGYDELCSGIGNQIQTSGAIPDPGWRDHARSPSAWALDGACEPELIRNARGGFSQVTMNTDIILDEVDFSASDLHAFKGCDLVIFETLTTGEIRTAIAEDMIAMIDCPIVVPESTNVAAGALEAARRYAAGEPVYFDFLPRISTIVLGQDGAANYDLVHSSETLPAGRIYRSPRPARFAIQPNQSEFSVHLRKDLEPWPRKARIEIGSRLPTAVQVELRVEQTPAAGRARLLIEAPAISRQFTIDWNGADEVQKSWDDLIAELGAAPATIPNRMVLPCGTGAWEDSPRASGLYNLLRENAGLEAVDWASLASRLASRPNGEYCISSDGDIPAEVPEGMVLLLERMTDRAMAHIRHRISGKVIANNESLKFLTWQFRRSPPELPGILLDAWEARSPLFRHPFATHSMNWVLIFQGFGRTCRTQKDESRALALLFATPIKDWSYRCETAAIAFLLSRSETAPLLLDRKHVDLLGKRVLIEFRQELGTKYTRFNYAPFLLAGLLRWRMKSPGALVIGRDQLADDLGEAIHRTLADFDKTPSRDLQKSAAVSRYRPILLQLLDELQGHGTNPDLLLDVFNLDAS
ncbi:hypothetical protein [Pseudotabrizicola formosa]|uniref:hypothetical protein n=1 Tax=Pseudotabrizicola formosa TaxID=2030009 RepID=UPI0011AF8608|nr:hypothetical protein [Pseudotabrizicola formosa]